MFKQLEYLDFDDELTEISTTWRQLKEKTKILVYFPKRPGLKADIAKQK